MIDLVLLQPPDVISWQPKMYFPLSLCYLGAVVRDAGYSVKVLDFRDSVKELPEAKFYGFSCTTPQVGLAKAIASKVSGQTIIGGAHASLLPEDCKNSFDYTVIGEGEEAILYILSGKIPQGSSIWASRIKDLDAIPYPAWDMVDEPFSDTLFPGERYGKGEKSATIIGSRGCPYGCSYCGNIYRSPTIFRSVENIVGELKLLKDRYNINYFRFEDDNFTLHPDFTNLCRKLSMLDIHYKAHTRSHLMTPKKAALLKYSGCEECGLGIESADDVVLKKNHKNEVVYQHGEAIKILKSAGLRAKVYLMAGLPGETDETIRLNKEFMITYKPEKWTLSTFSPYPGCAVYKNPEKFNVKIVEPDFSKWWNFAKDFNHVLDGQTREQMWIRYREFYDWLREEEWRA